MSAGGRRAGGLGRRWQGAGSRPEGTERGQLRGHRPRRQPQRIRPRAVANPSESFRPGDSSHVAREGREAEARVPPGARPGAARPGLARRRRRRERAGGSGLAGSRTPPAGRSRLLYPPSLSPALSQGSLALSYCPCMLGPEFSRPDSLWLRVLNFLECHLS